MYILDSIVRYWVAVVVVGEVVGFKVAIEDDIRSSGSSEFVSELFLVLGSWAGSSAAVVSCAVELSPPRSNRSPSLLAMVVGSGRVVDFATLSLFWADAFSGRPAWLGEFEVSMWGDMQETQGSRSTVSQCAQRGR